MKKPDSYTYSEACEDLRTAKMSYIEGSYRKAFDMLESLAYYVVSATAKETIEAEKLQELRKDVEVALGQFSFCKDECLWEKSSEVLDIFRQKK